MTIYYNENKNEIIEDELIEVEEVGEDDLYEEYNDTININGDIVINGLPYRASTVLKKIDKTAYEVGFSNYIDSRDDIIEADGTYYKK